MATTANYTRRQGEVWRTTIEMFDSNNCAILLASRGTDGPTGHQAFFAGTATKMIVTGQDTVTGNDITGEYNLPISFKLKPAETIESGRGSNRRTEEGYFKVEAFIPADTNQTSLDTEAPTSTIEMPVGDWEYVIRYSDSANPSSDQNVRVIVDGKLTIEALVADLGSNPGTFDYTAPGE